MCEYLLNHDPILEHNFKGHKGQILGLSFHPEIDQIASCSSEKSIYLWNLKNVRCYNFTGHTDVVTGIEYSRNGRLMVSCSLDQYVRIWVPTIKGGSTHFKAHTSAIRTVSFSPTDETVRKYKNDK